MTDYRGCPAVALLLAVSLLFCICSFPAEAQEIRQISAIDGEEIDLLFQNYVSENELNNDMISVAYVYTGTGETWYHLEDKWYYSASLYKVPLMMLLAEREAEGDLTQDSVINGMTLSTIEEEVLAQSNNDIAYSTMLSIAQPDVCRGMFRRYSSLPEEYYTWDFYGGSYFTARFMSDVMTTLYSEPDRFPHIVSTLKTAQPGHYFHLKIGDDYEIAQKYGCYHDEDGKDWNHTTGIIYTQTPFILTVMTRYGGISETIIADMAALFLDYTLRADQRFRDASEKYENSLQHLTEETVNLLPETGNTELGSVSSPETVQQRSDTDTVPAAEETDTLQPVKTDGTERSLLLIGAVGLTVMMTVLFAAQKMKKHTASENRKDY